MGQPEGLNSIKKSAKIRKGLGLSDHYLLTTS